MEAHEGRRVGAVVSGMQLSHVFLCALQCAARQKYDLIGVNVLFYGWPFHDSSGPRDIEFDDEAKRVVDYNGDADEAKSFAEFNMLVWLCNCPRSAHGFFYDKPHKRWVMIDNDRCLGKRQQPFPKFL